MSEQPGRYQRSAPGLVGAMIVLLLAVAAFVGYRALFRAELEVEPEALDYLEFVAAAQNNGVEVVYPPSLPKGWIATSAGTSGAERPSWRLGMLSETERFVGVRQEDRALDEMIELAVGEDDAEEVQEGEPVQTPGALAEEWRSFDAPDEDVILAAEVGENLVLVYGRLDREALADFAQTLTTESLTTEPSPAETD
ncbi:DUF4245 family protein [Nocardioides pacificus]